jgi:hypothetical protein
VILAMVERFEPILLTALQKFVDGHSRGKLSGDSAGFSSSSSSSEDASAPPENFANLFENDEFSMSEAVWE